MNHKRTKTSAILTTPFKLALVSATLLLSACETVGTQGALSFVGVPIAPQSLARAELPQYRTGDKFYYITGTGSNLSHKVVNANAGQVEWLTNRDRKIVTTQNTLVPDSYLETSTREYFKTNSNGVDALWPLGVGKSASFSTNITYRFKETGIQKSYQQFWKCNVEGAEQVRVFAGTFDTYVISCNRLSKSSTGRQKMRQTYIYHYAPELGHYVRRETRSRGQAGKTRELKAVRPSLNMLSDTAARGVRTTFQNALENLKSGEVQTWRDDQTGVEVSVSPVQTFQAANGKFCRNYRQVLNVGSGAKLYAGVACREDRLKWLTPTK